MTWFSRVGDRVRRQACVDDSGFTLIESMVALVIAAIVFMAVAAAAIAGVRAAVDSRLNQQAGDLANRAVEQARGLSYGALTMVKSSTTNDLNGDAAITGATGSTPTYVVPGVGSEPIDYHATGSVSPHVTTVTANVNHASFTVKQYVTVPTTATFDDSGFPSVKRFTVVVTWSAYGRSHSRVNSTLMTDTVRGLPLPNFTLRTTSASSVNVNAGVVVDFGMAIHNLGARDSFNITIASSTASLQSGWTFYLDDGANTTGSTTQSLAGDGVHQPGETNTLGNWDAAAGNTAPDTGPMDPNKDLSFVAERTTTSGDTGSVTFTATSTAQPTVASASHSLTYTITIATGTVTGGSTGGTGTCPAAPTSPAPSAGSQTSLVNFYLNNVPDGDTKTNTYNTVARGDCTAQTVSSLGKYSTDIDSNAGRLLRAGGTATTGTVPQVALWRWQPSATTTVKGTPTVSLYVNCTTGGTTVVNAAVGINNGATTTSQGTFTSASSGSKSVSCNGSWQRVDIGLSAISNLSVTESKKAADWLGLRVWNSGTIDARLAYDFTNVMSFLTIGVNP